MLARLRGVIASESAVLCLFVKAWGVVMASFAFHTLPAYIEFLQHTAFTFTCALTAR